MDLPLVAVGVGLVVGYAASVVSGAGTATWKLIERKGGARWTARKERRAVEAKAAHVAAENAVAAQVEADLRARLEVDRVGAQFLRRDTAEDLGTVVTVLELGLDWKRQVLVEEVALEGRPPTEFDHRPGLRVNIDWRALNLSEAEQRHATAHMIRSYDDADGWIRFERVA